MWQKVLKTILARLYTHSSLWAMPIWKQHISSKRGFPHSLTVSHSTSVAWVESLNLSGIVNCVTKLLNLIGEKSTGMYWEQDVLRKVHITMHGPIALLGKASLKKHLDNFHFSKGRKISRVKGGRGCTEDDERCFGGGGEEACVCTLKSTAPSQSHKFHPIPKSDVSANALSSQIQRQ